jgi:hypothetical protein
MMVPPPPAWQDEYAMEKAAELVAWLSHAHHQAQVQNHIHVVIAEAMLAASLPEAPK